MSGLRRSQNIAATVGGSRPVGILARLGYVASAIVHLLIGYLAIRVALQQNAETDQSGAIAQIAVLPGGIFVLWLTVIGLFALGLWLIVQAFMGVGSSSKKRWVRSLVAASKAVAYIALALTALTFALGSSSNANTSTQQASSGILALPGGQLLLGLMGLIAFTVGVYLVVKGIRRKFVADISVPRGPAERPILILGTVGYIAKGIAVAVVGVLFVIAAITINPSQATGLDGALKSLATLPFGTVVLIAVGIGLIAFGIYTFARARFARL
jgi:hypothetical protein